MCGIAGFVPENYERVPERPLLARMIAALHHRGPDARSVYVEPGVGLAHARLAIIDLKTGDQPIHNESGSICVVFNGEIFNFIELRAQLMSKGHKFRTESDTEVIVHAYEQFGLDFVHELNGQFAIALWDRSRRQLVLARDRTGIRPLLYSQTNEGLIFASEAKSLFASGLLRPTLDPVGIAEVCTFWSTLAPRTAFAGVSQLGPGHLAVYRAGNLYVKQYWDWEFPGSKDGCIKDLDAATDELRQLLLDSVRLQLRADVPVGTYLSGGLDSSAVTAAVQKTSSTRLKSFSVAFEDAEYDERSFQQSASKYLATEHETLVVGPGEIGAALPRAIEHIESPIVRTAGVPLMLLADRVRECGFKVVLTGEGADEIFAGYDIFKEAKIRRFWAHAPKSRWRGQLLSRLYGYVRNSPTSRSVLGHGFFAQGLELPNDPFFAHRLRWATTSRVLRLLTPEFRAQIDSQHAIVRITDLVPKPNSTWHTLSQDQYVEAHTLLPGYLLHAQGDRVAMAASVEGRYPFLDHRIIEFANRLPPKWKLRGLQEKHILRRAVSPWLPPDIARRPKQPYRAPDSASFFRGGAPLEYVDYALSPTQLRRAGYFDCEGVSRLFEKCRSGSATGFSDNMAFMSILTTQLLHQIFIDRPRSVGM